MKRISQRELRNNSGEIMRGLEQGDSYELTNRGKVVGRVVPAEESALERMTLRHARGPLRLPTPITHPERSEDVLRELRGAR